MIFYRRVSPADCILVEIMTVTLFLQSIDLATDKTSIGGDMYKYFGPIAVLFAQVLQTSNHSRHGFDTSSCNPT
jgi:hypothetical protein